MTGRGAGRVRSPLCLAAHPVRNPRPQRTGSAGICRTGEARARVRKIAPSAQTPRPDPLSLCLTADPVRNPRPQHTGSAGTHRTGEARARVREIVPVGQDRTGCADPATQSPLPLHPAVEPVRKPRPQHTGSAGTHRAGRVMPGTGTHRCTEPTAGFTLPASCRRAGSETTLATHRVGRITLGRQDHTRWAGRHRAYGYRSPGPRSLRPTIEPVLKPR